MTDRPFGVTVLCALFALAGVGFVLSGFDLTGRAGDVSTDLPLSVDVFLTVMPIFAVGLGLLALYAAVALFGGSKRGFFAALAVLGLWILEEVILLAWGILGPEIVQRSTDASNNIVRMLVAVGLIYYLVQQADGFVFDRSTERARGRSSQ